VDAPEFDLEPTGYNLVATFDGRVLEIFGNLSDDSSRVHAKFLSVSVSEPDKKGRRTVRLHGGGFDLFLSQLDDGAVQAVQPLLDALRNAGVPSTG
jgi:hypothetical protein